MSHPGREESNNDKSRKNNKYCRRRFLMLAHPLINFGLQRYQIEPTVNHANRRFNGIYSRKKLA